MPAESKSPSVEEPASYSLELLDSALKVDAAAWDRLLASQSHPTPFMRHAYLAAMESSRSATPETGWTPVFCLLKKNGTLEAACALYAKTHSYGEYVFDWAWADAYQRHGLTYYPKGVLAVPFTPVPGSRLLAVSGEARTLLLKGLIDWAEEAELSSIHMLFASDADLRAATDLGLMLRHTVQFHWHNRHPHTGEVFESFDDFLASLNQEKRKKIRQERRRVHDAGIEFDIIEGPQLSNADWDFFYDCYERTYLEHGNAPYLTRSFFERMQRDMPENWVLFIARQGDARIASSLIAVQDGVAYGRYWGALARVDNLHFETCYYQPLQWCIERGLARFEGGAQGQHKMARALMPVQTHSAHWLAHPGFAEAVERFLEREGQGIAQYMDELNDRSPFKRNP
ncbi:GNAT family N-acetyltransferase [Diaphorobacter aerolatus]|uniref:N-acetyltransferase n=1 Tax=Diaphorobacter aerolatus TaxID=1288495 RepID=A0A7H0GLA9_9BURK|nr:GNAT family N-acetyltransferase [Diaphorobacter aerolatus]QNP49075.1 N-acetyltransferase [Diaphorobacter aerolatus]